MTDSPYPSLASNVDFAALEREVLDFWKKEQVFEASVAHRPASVDGATNAFVFYDGPPFANGLPHYGHLLTGYVKDLVARYQTMRGKRVERRFGWDCHGLPAEMQAEKELGISGRQKIMEYGIGKFNEYCRTSVMRYTQEWQQYVDRQGRWVDFANDYKTMDTSFMESVLWAFKQLHEKGYIYEAYRVLPYSWGAETPLSNFETRLDNATRERVDKAVTVAFELNERPEGAPEAEKYFVLAWTTTPWTLPSNLALAVHPEHFYIPIVVENKCYMLGWKALAGLWTSLVLTGRLETSRCYLRPFTENDLDLLKQLHNHPEVAATTYDGIQSDETLQKHLDSYLAEQKKHGFSQWAVFEKGTDKFVGRAGLSLRQLDPDRPPQWEIRRALVPEFWSKGVGTELARMWLTLAFYVLKAPMVCAGSMPGSEKAQAAQRKVGFTYEKQVPVRDNQMGQYHIIDEAAFLKANAMSGASLIGSGYKPLFPYFADHPNAFRILDGSDFIEEGSGSGIVHMAPGFGEADQKCCEANGISLVVPVDGAGKYTDEIYDLPDLNLKGLNVIADTRKDTDEPYTEAQLQKYGLANLRITQWLKERGQLIKQEDYSHNYPHCWRTDTPLIYRAMPSWYVKVTEFKHRAVESNRKINWVPGHVRDGAMGHMLETAPDWSISRNRFWGCPIPIWKSDNPANKQLYVFGSIAELQEFFKCEVKDLHRPYIDELTAPDPTDARYTLRRVEDVLDCWFESGSMPYAQLHYPFENKEKFEANFPADFITEYIAQTRGWFNTLIMLSTAIFDREPFTNVICHGVVIDEETGLKYSKRLKNYKDPMEVIEQFGADALRWLMVASPVMRGQDLGVDPDGKFIRDVVRLYIKPIWNAYHFFCLYANADKVKAEFRTDSDNAMDRYILAKCREMLRTVQSALDAYDTPTACSAISQFSEVLNNWYIRRNRARFWKGERDADKMSAYHTLYTVLHCVARAAAPLLPFTMEAMFAGLTNSGVMAQASSVHLQDFPHELEAADLRAEDVLYDMDRVRDICNAAHGIRNVENIRVRQPLATLTVYQPRLKANHEYYCSLIADEVNVKDVVFSEELEAVATLKLKIHFPVAGKRLGGKMKEVGAAAKAGQWTRDASGAVVVAGEALTSEEYDLTLEAKDAKGSQPLAAQDGLVKLDLTLTPALEAEGIARDVVRLVQEARKNAQFDITDRITLTIKARDGVASAIESHRGYIAEQTLANAIAVGEAVQGAFTTQAELDGQGIELGLSRAA